MNTLRPAHALATFALLLVALVTSACESEGYTDVLDVEGSSTPTQTPTQTPVQTPAVQAKR